MVELFAFLGALVLIAKFWRTILPVVMTLAVGFVMVIIFAAGIISAENNAAYQADWQQRKQHFTCTPQWDDKDLDLIDVQPELFSELDRKRHKTEKAEEQSWKQQNC